MKDIVERLRQSTLYDAPTALSREAAAEIEQLRRWQNDACGTLLAFDAYVSTPGSRLAFDSIRRHLLQRAGRGR